jgi:hypothetical protein
VIIVPARAFEAHYAVSDDGRVFRRHPDGALSELTPYPSKGYFVVRVSDGTTNHRPQVPIHRLVASTFLELPDGNLEVNHIDGDKTNNVVTNLEWVTPEENQAHARRLGLGAASKPVVATAIDDSTVLKFESIGAAGRGGFDPNAVRQCCKGRARSHRGYRWAYLSE